MADFPPVALAGKEDSKFRTQSSDDPAMRNTTDGGYTITRARYTRAPRKTYTTGFTDLTETELAALEAFYDAQFGGSNSFTWEDPVTNVVHTVRFNAAIKGIYTGRGGTHRFDVPEIQLKEV